MLKIALIGLFMSLVSCSDSLSSPAYNFVKGKTETGEVAKAGKYSVSQSELEEDGGFRTELYQKKTELFEIKLARVKEVLLDKIYKAEAGGMDKNAFFEKNVFSKIKVSDNDVKTFATEKGVPADQLNDQLKERIKQHLQQEKRAAALESWMASKIGKPIDIFLEKPSRPVFQLPPIGESPTYGPNDAKVTIYEYSDFQCPHCSHAVETINKIKKEYSNKVKVVYKNFPLPFHGDAKTASMAALCAKEQKTDIFWPFHNHLFKNQSNLKVEDLKKYAKEFKLDQAKFDKCLDDQKYKTFVEADYEAGKKAGVSSTPTFFVNGKIVSGAQPFEVFSEIIKEELQL